MKSKILLDDFRPARVRDSRGNIAIFKHLNRLIESERVGFVLAAQDAVRYHVSRDVKEAAISYIREQEAAGNKLPIDGPALDRGPVYIQWPIIMDDKEVGLTGVLLTRERWYSVHRENLSPSGQSYLNSFSLDTRIGGEPDLICIKKNRPDTDVDEKTQSVACLMMMDIFTYYVNNKDKVAVIKGEPESRIKEGKRVPFPDHFEIVSDLEGLIKKEHMEIKEDFQVKPVYWLQSDPPMIMTQCSVTREVGGVPFPTNLWSKDISPKEVTAAFRAAGWDFDPHNADRIRCPAEAILTPKPRPKLTLMPQEKTMTTPTPAPPRALTPKERARIRDILDEQFDEDAGHYRNGYSDAKIGDALDIPFKLVSDMREAAYGPIRSDPEIDGLLDSLGGMELRTKDCEAAVEKLLQEIEEIKACATSIRGRIDTLAARRRKSA